MESNSSTVSNSMTTSVSPLSIKFQSDFEVYAYFAANMSMDEVAQEYFNRWHGNRIIPMEITVAICICGTILNTVNIIVFSRKAMLSSISVLLMAFETANILIFLSFFVQSVDYFAPRSFIFTFMWAFFLRLYPFMRLFGANSLSWFAAFVGVWRCIAVASTIKAHKWLTKSRANKLVITITVLSFLFSIQSVFISNFYEEVRMDPITGENRTIHCLLPSKVYYKHRLIIVSVNMIVCAVIPAVIQVVSTSYLIYSLYRASGLRKTLSKRSTRQVTSNDDGKEKGISVMMLTVLLLFLLNWIPYIIAAGIYFGFIDQYRMGLITWSPQKVIQYLLMDDTLPLLNNTCTFFIYYHMSENFRLVFWRFFKKPKLIVSSSQTSLKSRL